MTGYVSLLRGINVGGNKIIKMEALRALHEELGLAGAQTLLQSGNVVFASNEADAAALARRIKDGIRRRFALDVEIMLRRAAELDRILRRNPFPEEGRRDPSHLLVMFLAAPPKADAKAALASAEVAPERLEIIGSEVFLYYPNGIGRSKLTGTLIEKRLGIAGTARNLNTLAKLLEMAQALETG
jgi:uncharacterized protein (DUF1697 family)